MLVYLILLLTSILFALVPGRKNQRKVFGILLFTMFALCGLRGPDVGMDTWNYLNIYESDGGRYEPLFQLIRSFCQWVGTGSQVFLCIMAGITFAPLFILMGKDSCRPALSVLVFLTFSVLFFHQIMNTVRASAAMPYCLLACHYWERRKWWGAGICLVVAAGLHYSAIVVVLLIVACSLFHKMRKIDYYLLIIVSSLIGLVFTFKISSFLGKWLNEITALALFSSGTGNYLGSTYLQSLQETNLNLFGLIGTLFPLSFFCFVLYDKQNRDSLYYKLFVLGVVLSNVFLSIAIVYRIAMMITPFIVILLPNTLRRAHNWRKVLLQVGTCVMILWYGYQLFTAGPRDMAGTVPYYFFWN